MIETFLDQAKNPCVFFSGGKDSLVVLDMVRKIKPDVTVITFRQDMHEEQWEIIDQVIRLWDLQVVSFPPSHTYIVPNDNGLARVDEYSLNRAVLPVIRDIVPGSSCIFDSNRQRLASFPFEHDVAFLGTRKEDGNSVLPRPLNRAIFSSGDTTFVAPIYDWTQEEVDEAAKDLPFSKEFYTYGDERYDTGNLVACSACLQQKESRVFCPKVKKMIPVLRWNPEAMLSAFQEKFEVKDAN